MGVDLGPLTISGKTPAKYTVRGDLGPIYLALEVRGGAKSKTPIQNPRYFFAVLRYFSIFCDILKCGAKSVFDLIRFGWKAHILDVNYRI